MKTTKIKITSAQITDFYVYEKVRASARFNMYDPRARRATGLAPANYAFVMDNYEACRDAANKEAGKPTPPPFTPEKRRELEALWFLYGNNGAKHSHGNHKFIQGILERGEDDREFFKRPNRMPGWGPLTKECEEAVDAVLKKGRKS